MGEGTKSSMRDFFPVFSMVGLFVLIHGLALLIVGPFEAADVVVFDDPNAPMNLVFFFCTLLLTTIVILLIARFWKKKVIQGIILGLIGYFAFYVFYSLLGIIIAEVWSLFLSIVAAAILVVALVKYPEWYVINACCIIVGVGAIAIFGISLSILLVIVLLIGMATYDAIAVYRTKHMIDLADTVLDLRLPLVLVIPKIRQYSLIKDTKRLKAKLEEGEERQAFFMGLGDVIIPGFLVASTFHNITGNGLLMALSVMLGTLVGFAVLMKAVVKGNPQAGLPYLCSGAILGYVVSSYLLYGQLVGLGFPM